MSRGMKGLAAFGVPAGAGTVAKDAIDAALGRKSSRYTRHYRQHLLTADRRVDSKGPSTVGDNTPELDAVFVDLAVERAPADRVSAGAVDSPAVEDDAEVGESASTEGGDRQTVHGFLDRREAAVLAVIGGPGCGKTTLLRHLAREAARRNTHRRRIPVFLTLSRLSTPISDGSNLPRLLRIEPPQLRVPEPKGWWEEQLYDGNCLILMDGLDEVADETDRRRTADWIAEQISAFPGNDFVITSRPGGYRQAEVQGAQVLAVQQLGRAQIERFLHGWYLATEREATGADDSGADAIAAGKADDLIDRLSDAPNLDELTANPLLLTMIALVHRYRGALPRDRADLYEELCRAMLWSRHEAHGATVELSGEAKWEVLAQLAFNLMKSRKRSIDSAKVPPLIQDALEAGLPGIDGEQFLREMCGNGLLVETERGLYAFAHQTIGEYLAARHIIDRGLEGELTGFVDDPWWAGTIELYAARARDLDKLVETCLRKGTEGAMVQAFTSADCDGRLDPGLRDRLHRLEQRAFSTGFDPAVSRAVARTRVLRHLGRLKRLGDDGFYCPQPITESLYRLYRNATGPSETIVSAPDEDRSVSGLWPDEVKPLVDWINAANRYGDSTDSPFRLPNRDESRLIRAAATGPDGPSPVWRASARGPELPFTVSRQRLLSTVAEDIATVGLRASAVFALLLDEATTMKRSSAPIGPDSGGRAERDHVDAVTAAADADGFRRLIASFSELSAPRTSHDLVLSDAKVFHRFDEARAAAVRESLRQGIGKVYRDRRPESFGWLPPSAAAFTDRRHAEALSAATQLARLDGDDTDARLAEVLLSRAGITDPAGLRIVLGNASPASRNPDIALRESVAPPGRWHESVSRDLAEKARRILTRQDPLRAPSVLRLSGLIAAAEFESERNQLNRDACLNIVALVAFLEHRTGTDYPGEAMILVRD